MDEVKGSGRGAAEPGEAEMADSVRKRWIKTEGGNWSTGLRRDAERG